MTTYYRRDEIPDDLLEFFEEIPLSPTPCTVLDPFHGSGTTSHVAARLGRSYIGVDLADEYLNDITNERMGSGVQMEICY